METSHWSIKGRITMDAYWVRFVIVLVVNYLGLRFIVRAYNLSSLSFCKLLAFLGSNPYLLGPIVPGVSKSIQL